MADESKQPYIVVERQGSGVGSFLFGAICGAVAGLLFAPKSGEETQQELREGADRLRSDAENKMEELRSELAGAYDRARAEVADRVGTARDELRQKRHEAGEAVRAGRDVARSAREDLEKRVAESKRAYRETIERSAAEQESGAEGEESRGESGAES